MVGLPFSGKSSIARSKGYPIVSPDALRMSLYARRFDPEQEGGIWWMTRLFVKSLFLAGHENVILDACTITVNRRSNWASNDIWSTKFVVMPEDAEECIRRATKVGNATVIPMINKMAIQSEPLTREEAFAAVDPYSQDW